MKKSNVSEASATPTREAYPSSILSPIHDIHDKKLK